MVFLDVCRPLVTPFRGAVHDAVRDNRQRLDICRSDDAFVGGPGDGVPQAGVCRLDRNGRWRLDRKGG
jgi:hypothetical protein